MLKTFWTVKRAIFGASPADIYFDDYETAKQYSRRDYCDKPVKHTVKLETYAALEAVGAFYYGRREAQ